MVTLHHEDAVFFMLKNFVLNPAESLPLIETKPL